jgi:rhodanese-related sulfurtransferase
MNEATSARAALQLRERGYEAYALTGSLGAWLDAGYPTQPKAQEATR